MSTSIRNRLAGTIEKIVSDKVVSEVLIRTAAGNVTSIITTGSVERMNLKEGDNVSAIIKATEVSKGIGSWSRLNGVRPRQPSCGRRIRRWRGRRGRVENRANGISDIEGKAVRVAASECGQRVSFN